MESAEVKGELLAFRQRSEGRGYDLVKDELKCDSYDDISSDACSDAVDTEKQIEAVSGETENMVEANTEKTKQINIDDVKVRQSKSAENDSRSLCSKQNMDKTGEAINVKEVEHNVIRDVMNHHTKEQEVAAKLSNNDTDHPNTGHSIEMKSDEKTSVEHALGFKVQETNIVQSEENVHGSKSVRDNTNSTCEYRSGFKHSLYGKSSPIDRCSPPNFSSDSDTDFSNLKSHNQKLIKSLLSSECDLMKFAEILYKCTLCTSIPSILTSKSSFLKHVKEQHFTNDSCLKKCEFCSLKFRTEGDLKEHVRHLHKETNQITDMVSHDKTRKDVTKPHANLDNENDSDSDSSGHRNYKAKLIKKVKPVLDFENPKQLVDHTGIQTLDGSLDLSKKDSSSKIEHKEHTISVKAEQKSPKHSQEPNMVHVQQITDQIMKSNFQGRNPSTPSTPLSFTPSFTREFGKYTKLVREGGNIVYFCQVCNWKSPIKATFHGHCGTATHKSKVLQTEDPDSAESSLSCDRTSSSRSSPNTAASVASEPKPRDSSYWAGQNRSYMSKISESGHYGQFAQPRGVSFNGRSPVMSPFKNGNSNERHNPYKRGSESAVDMAHKSSKKSASSSASGKKAKPRGCSSDSDSDEAANSKTSDHLFPWNKNPLEMSSLYQNYPFLSFCPPSRYSYDRLYSAAVGANKLAQEAIIKAETDTAEYPKNASQLFSFASNKRHTEMHPPEEGSPNKRSKDDNAESTESAKHSGDKVESLFKLYKCHACPFEYSDIEEYEKHFEEVHKTVSQAEVGARSFLEKQVGRCPPDISGADFETGENFRVQKLKEILPEYIVDDKKGNVARDYLLQCISLRGIPNVELWSSACNKAMREVYPHSLAQRKGKYKKTYYFGVAMTESYQGQEEQSQQTEGDAQLYNPLRDLNLDMEKVMEQLPAVLFWTGSMEAGVYRGEILMVIADSLQNQDVLNWGPQCNRAIRLVFPKVDIKRKGKFKSTMYFGVDFHSSVKKGPILSQSKGMPMSGGFLDGGDSLVLPSEGFPQGLEGFPQGEEEFPMWMRQEAQKNMKWYLQRFGGVTAGDMPDNDDADDGDDGDDEGESVESSANL